MTAPGYDAIVLGAGAAGLMCAAVAGQRGRRVLLLDHADQVGKKILISGGGRCNFTNIHTAPDRFLSANPHFAKSALARYTAAEIDKLHTLAKKGMALKAIAKALTRSEESVKVRAKADGLSIAKLH